MAFNPYHTPEWNRSAGLGGFFVAVSFKMVRLGSCLYLGFRVPYKDVHLVLGSLHPKAVLEKAKLQAEPLEAGKP